MFKSRKKFEKVTDRNVAELKDLAIFNFSGRVKDEEFPFPGGTAEKYKLILGSNQFIPGFEAAMVGKPVGEEFQFELDFPTDYHSGALAGKTTVWTIYIHELQTEVKK